MGTDFRDRLNRRLVAKLTVGLLLLDIAGCLNLQASTEVYTDPVAYQVYSALLESNKRFHAAKRPLIRAETVPCPFPGCLPPAGSYKAVVRSAIENYKRVYLKRWTLTNSFNVRKPYELVPEREFSHGWIRPSPAWDKRFAEEPEFAGFFEFSAVGFNEQKTVAVVYIRSNCGVLCTNSDLVVLRKTGDSWKLLEVLLFAKA